MPILRENDFDEAAGRAVNRFLSGGSKLADAVAEEAVHGSMNPDQIERLVQAANTMAFLRMMEERKSQGAGDLLHEFDPTDARHIIQMIVGAEDAPPVGHAPPGPEGSFGADELPDEMAAVRHPPNGAPEMEGADGAKDAPKDKPKGEEKDEEKNKAKEEKAAALRANRMRKLAGILEDQYAALKGRFKRAHAPLNFADFEKDALAECGSAVGVHVLNAMREERGLPALDHGAAREKVAALADRHVADDTEELRLFGQIVKIAEEAHRLQEGVAWMRAQCA